MPLKYLDSSFVFEPHSSDDYWIGRSRPFEPSPAQSEPAAADEGGATCVDCLKYVSYLAGLS